MNFADFGAKWIWADGVSGNDRYADFLGCVRLDTAPQNAEFLISADSDYAFWINGVRVEAGHYDDYPENRTFDRIDVTAFLHAGENRVAVIGYFQGTGTFQYAPGVPGVIFALVSDGCTVWKSGADVLSREDRVFRGGVSPLITSQVGYSFDADGRGEDGWKEEGYELTDKGWKSAEIMSGELYGLDLRERPTKKLILKDRVTPEIIAQGKFLHAMPLPKTAAERVETDFLSPIEAGKLFETGLRKLPYASEIFLDGSPVRVNEDAYSGTDGFYLVLDLGREEAGTFEIDIDAPEGTRIDAAWGQHLGDLRVRSFVGGRCFGAVYTTGEGRCKFENPFRRFGARYLQLHVAPIEEGAVTLYYAGVRPWEYPVEYRGNFACEDSLHERIWEVSRRTLELCMHEHYEDTPWREQAFYISDSRNQALCGYYAFDEYAFPAACFGLYKDAFDAPMRSDLCCPCHSGLCIPSFTLVWPTALWEHWMYSGDDSVIRACAERLAEMMDAAVAHIDATGLVKTSGEAGIWNFYEWSDGMGGDGDKTQVRDIRRYEAPMQMFIIRALRLTSEMLNAVGYSCDTAKWLAAADSLTRRTNEIFWNEQTGLYATYWENGVRSHWAQLTQALAICSDVVPSEKADALRKKLLSSENMVKCTISYSVYKYDALLSGGQDYAEPVFAEVARDWGMMLEHGATSFWETILGQKDFDNAGSLCHGWSAVPLYLYMRYALGVYPTAPGFTKYAVNPITPFASAEGIVPTPHGNIHVAVRDGIAQTVVTERE